MSETPRFQLRDRVVTANSLSPYPDDLHGAVTAIALDDVDIYGNPIEPPFSYQLDHCADWWHEPVLEFE